MSFDLKQINVIPAEKGNETHKRGVWRVYNENLDFNLITYERVPYEKHSNWWLTAFENEHIYVIIMNLEVCGYIRLTKISGKFKEKNEISIAITNKYQGLGIGSYAYKIFEEDIKRKGINKISASVLLKNKTGQEFFEKNDFKKKIPIKYYIKNNHKEPYLFYIKQI